MTLKELKAITDLCDIEKDRLKDFSRLSKDTRIEMRKVQNNIRDINMQIGSLDTKGTIASKGYSERSAISPDYMEHYQIAFQKIVIENLFDKIKSKSEWEKEKEREKEREKEKEKYKEWNIEKDEEKEYNDNMNLVSIDIEFEKVKISFFIGHETRFRDLRKQAASYWSLPLDEIFFSDEPPTNSAQAIFLLDNYIVEEIYIWNRIKIKDHNFLLYLVLRNYNSLENRMEQLFPKNENPEQTYSDTEDVGINLVSNRKKRIAKVIIKEEAVKNRKKWYIIQTITQVAILLPLFFLWVFLLVQEMNISQATWMNSKLESIFFYKFPYQESFNSLYGSEVNTALKEGSDLNGIYQYINYIKYVLYTVNDGRGIISNSLYALDYVELRQLRTKINACNNTYIGEYNCTNGYNWFSSASQENLGPADYQQFYHGNPAVYIYGSIGLYPYNGYRATLSTTNETEWNETINALQSTNWLDSGTRVLFMQMGFVNPTSNIITMLLPFVEISEAGVYILNFKIYSIQGLLYRDSRLYIHIFIFILALLLLFFELRQNLRLIEEIKYLDPKNKEKTNLDELYDNIMSHCAKSIFRRFRKPKVGEWFVFFTIFSVITLEIVGYVWYVTEYKHLLNNPNDAATVFIASQAYSMINDARKIVIIILALNIIRYFINWLSNVSKMFEVVLYALSQYLFYIVLCLLPLFAFSIHFYYFLGAYDSNFCAVDIAIVSTIRIFIGHWPTNTYFLNYIQSGYLVLLYFCFYLWKMIIINFQIIIIYNKLNLMKNNGRITN